MRRSEYNLALRSRLPLTKKQQETIAYAAVGLTYKQIAQVLGISIHTVKIRLDKARFKLDALNLRHAVVLYLAGKVNKQ